jgi:hypothetical protein
MDIRKLRKIIVEECDNMMGHKDGAAPIMKSLGGLTFEDSDSYEESSMIKNNLHTLKNQSNDLYDIVEDGDDLPEWVQEKIAIASDYIDVIYNYLQAESERTDS